MNRTVTSFRKCISSVISDTGRSSPCSDGANVVKKKLCRVSNGYINGQNLLQFRRRHDDDDDDSPEEENGFHRRGQSSTEGVAKEICGEQFVEICVVRRNEKNSVNDNLLNKITNTDDKVTEADISENGDSLDVVEISGERNESLIGDQRRRKRVAFSDAIVVHSFENQDDNSDQNSEITPEIDDNQNDIKLGKSADALIYCGTTAVNGIQVDSETPTMPKKLPLRRLLFGRSNSRASLLFRSFVRDSIRRQGSTQRGRTTVARTKSLVDRSVRHSFIDVDDPNGTHVQLVVPLGPHFAANGVSVTTSGDGKKIKVLAIGRRGVEEEEEEEEEDHRHDYHECFYLPKAIDPLHTNATVNREGCLEISAPFVANYSVHRLDKLIR